MSWKPLRSRVLQVDWSALQEHAVDPYLSWADATRFTGFEALEEESERRLADVETGLVAIAFELAPEATVDQLQQAVVANSETNVPWWPIFIGHRFGVVRVPVSWLSALYRPPLCDLVARFELGLPLKTTLGVADYAALLQSDGAVQCEPMSAQPATYAAVIDDGCAFANKSFLTKGFDGAMNTRIHRLWFQEDTRPVDADARHLGYTEKHLNDYLRQRGGTSALCESSAYRRLAANLVERGMGPLAARWTDQMRMPAAHGTHVLDVMAGAPNPLAQSRYGFGTADDSASRAPIIFVQLPRSAVADTSGGSMNCNVLEALAYIASAVRAPHEVIINLSYGGLAGPHDGSTLLEEAIDHFLETSPRVKCLTLPAGNGYESRTHARLTSHADARWQEFRLQLLPGDPTDTFVEIWYLPTEAGQTGRAVIDVEVLSPAGVRSGPVTVGAFKEWSTDGRDVPEAALLHVKRASAGGGAKHMVLLALAPTTANDSTRRTTHHGTWTIRVRNRGGRPTTIDAWIERDDSSFGAGRSRSQAVFLSAGTGPAPGHPHAATFPIERQMCLNSFAHGARPEVVGGYSLRVSAAPTLPDAPEPVARYSASGPGRKGDWSGPNICAPCEESAEVGLLAASTRSSGPAYMSGTSVASAALARQRLNGVEPIAPDSKSSTDQGPVDRPSTHAPWPDPRLRRGAGRLEPAR